MRFKDLTIGSRFVFSSENNPQFRISGLARGPWIKTGPRKYRHEFDDAMNSVRIGSIMTKVDKLEGIEKGKGNGYEN